MGIFGTNPTDETTETTLPGMDMETLFTLHTAIDCIRYGEKAAGFLTELPNIEADKIGKYGYSVIMRFEDNFAESYQDDQGTWQKRGSGSMALVTPLYIRLHKQAEAAMAFTNKVFKSGLLTHTMVQAVLDYVQNNGPCPVTDIGEFKFSEQDDGLKEYISFQTNVAIGQALRVFKSTGTRNIQKRLLSAQIVDDLAELEIYERGQMPVAPTPDAGEIMTFCTDETDMQSTGAIEVDETDLYPLKRAQDNLNLWWKTIDKRTDRMNLVDIMVTEAREFLAEKQKNPTTPGFVMAS